MSTLVKTAFILLLWIFSSLTLSAQSNMELLGHLDYPQKVNDVWGYAAPDSTEYALVGTQTGVSIVSLADAENPVELFFVQGTETTWRDMKTWQHYAYAVCDACTDGLLIMDLSDLPNSLPYHYWTELPDTTFEKAHNIFIDEYGYAYISGTALAGRKTIYLDLFTNPEAPQFIGYGPEEYAHDVYVRNNILYAAEIYNGQVAIYDVSDKSNTILLGSAETPSSFTHNTWLSDDGNTVYTTDEKAYASTTSYDVSDLSDIKMLDRFFSEASVGLASIPHNVHVLDNYLIISHYTDGVVIADAQYPDNLVQVAQYDTYPPERVGFNGCWGAYPFLPSGNVLASDRQSGLFVLKPNYQRAAYLHGSVSDANTNYPLPNANIFLEGLNSTSSTDAQGNFKTGIAQGGEFTLSVKKKFYDDEVLNVSLTNDEITQVNIALKLTPIRSINGIALDKSSGKPIPNAQIILQSDYYQYETTTNSEGLFAIDGVYFRHYALLAGKWGYRSDSIPLRIDETTGLIQLELTPDYEDNFMMDLGWTISSEAEHGDWLRDMPQGSYYNTGNNDAFLSPDEDSPADLGNYAMLTGNGGDSRTQAALKGFTRLASPPIDMRNWNAPKVSFYKWFCSLRGPDLDNLQSGGGHLDFKIYNGRDTVLIHRWQNNLSAPLPTWMYEEFDILQHIAITDHMQFIFEAQSGPYETAYHESAIDFFHTWDANPQGLIQVCSPPDLVIYPNPFKGSFHFHYQVSTIVGTKIRLFDALGRELLSIPLETTRGLMSLGNGLAPGLYFLSLECGSQKVLRAVVGL